MVFVVNILSPKIYQVSIENTNIPILDPINLADQADPAAAVMFLQAYQKNMLVGRPIVMAARNGRSFHHSDTFCRFN